MVLISPIIEMNKVEPNPRQNNGNPLRSFSIDASRFMRFDQICMDSPPSRKKECPGHSPNTVSRRGILPQHRKGGIHGQTKPRISEKGQICRFFKAFSSY
jgi:hypothetical protein